MNRLALWWFRRRGWTMVGTRPSQAKYVVAGAPHTSNSDFVAFLAAVRYFDIPARYIGKHTLFRWPLGGLMRRLGGIPVRRHTSQGLVEQVVAEFGRAEEMALVLAPEGTRSRGEYWHSGFYRIAVGARVPIVCGFVDYATKTIGLGPAIEPTGDVRADMDRIRAFYAGKRGRRPGQETPPRLREEDSSIDG
jgi:1-acyl-sn-glycerol-3-phosphate acyltransferase